MARNKTMTSFRVSDYFTENLKKLAESYGLSQAGTIELLVRMCETSPDRVMDNKKVHKIVQKEREASTPMESHPFRLSDGGREAIDRLSESWGISKAEVLEHCVAYHVTGKNGMLV